MLQMANYKLGDMLGIAGATIGIIIAAGILLQLLSMRYTGTFERYRALTGEMRQHRDRDARQDLLRDQIVSYHKRIDRLNVGTILVTLAVLLFLITVAVASVAVMYPNDMLFRTLGTASLFLGLALIFAGVFLLLIETVAERGLVSSESDDIQNFLVAPRPENKST